MRRTTVVGIACLGWWILPPGPILAADEVTTITITDKVLMDDAQPLGINISGDNYYSPPLSKRRFHANFEGGVWRAVDGLWQVDAAGREDWVPVKIPEEWQPILVERGRYTLMSGPKIWKTGKILGFDKVEVPSRNDPNLKVKQTVMRIDQKEVAGKDAKGKPLAPIVMVEADLTDKGYLYELKGDRGSEQNELVHGDVPEGSLGNTALNMKGSDKKSFIKFYLTTPNLMACVGKWRVSFQAKARAGHPQLQIISSHGAAQTAVTPAPQWQAYRPVLEVKEATGKDFFTITMECTGGDVLVDDIEVLKEGDQNPTMFTDDFVNTMKDMNIGVIRQLQMAGDNMHNYLQEPLQAYAWGRGSDPLQRKNKWDWSVTEFYTLCEYLKAEPWYSLPGTITPEEVGQFVEYLGAPADVGYGQLRARQGHPKPWTEVFKQIHVQVANECITFGGNSPNPETWAGYLKAARDSRFYKPNIELIASTQDMSGGWLDPTQKYAKLKPEAPKVGSICEASYFLRDLWKEDMARYANPAELYRWIFSIPVEEWTLPNGKLAKTWSRLQGSGIGLSIYESSYHTTFGQAAAAQRNGIITSLGGALAQMNNLLIPMKQYGVRTQCHFTFNQFQFAPGGSFGDDFEGKYVRLWGVVLNTRAGQRRYRPIALGMAAANKAIGGKMLETMQEGLNPTFESSGRYNPAGKKGLDGKRHYAADQVKIEKLTSPVIWSYAFADGQKRGLILINLDTTQNRLVKLNFTGEAASGAAQATWLTANEITASNEPEVGDPQVRLREENIADFASGKTLSLPPFAMAVLTWKVK